MKLLLIIALMVVVLGVIVVMRGRRSAPPLEILPADEMQKKYDLYAENRENIEIDPENVPPGLRDLIPLAEKWGLGDDIIRGDVMAKATDDEKNTFKETLRGRTDEVTAWLDAFDNANPMPEDAVPFMYMLEALDESGLWPD